MTPLSERSLSRYDEEETVGRKVGRMAGRAGVSSRRQRAGKAADGKSKARVKAASPGSGGRDRRTAYVPLKHDSETITTRWSRRGRKGESDTGTAEQPAPAIRLPAGVSATATRATLYKIAKRLAIKGRSAMTRRQLMDAISSPAPAKVRVKSR
jgi:hypothetical protein